MSWMKGLYDTYDRVEDSGDRTLKKSLLKVGHSTQNAHVEVTIDEEGNFQRASLVGKDEAETVIPVNESSASRSSGIAPHPLFDKLKYLAGGEYMTYCGEDNSGYHEKYMEGLKEWVDSPYSSIKLKAVYEYLAGKNLIKDLIHDNIFSVDENGKLTKKWLKADKIKLSIGEQQDAFIRFRVNCINFLDNKPALWQDEELQNQYIKFYLSKASDEKFCYIKGDSLRTCANHPSKIRNTADKAKLISSNDTSNFTYLGRFTDAAQAFTISYEASQKSHNALKWLVSKQGTKVGDKVFILWGIEQEKVPNLLANTADIGEEEEEDFVDLATPIAEKFSKAIAGYRAQLTNKSRLILLGLDGATTGRLSVVFSREYYGEQGNELIDNIERWHRTAAWKVSYWIKKKGEQDKYIKRYDYIAPAPADIAAAAFGTEKNGWIECDNRVKASLVERLLPCISDGSAVPRDIVHAAVKKALFPQNYKEADNWKQVLSIACAMYKKYLYDYKKEVVDMKVVENSGNLEYDCGRLLAIADAIEARALDIKKDGNFKEVRATNAVRYFTRFAQRPYITWAEIEKKLKPYEIQLGHRGDDLYKLRGHISQQIDLEEFRAAKNLGGGFCLGFDSQRQALIDEKIRRKNASEANKNSVEVE